MQTNTFRTAWPLWIGMTVAGAAAVTASAATLASLADAAGWSGYTPWLLPAAVDIGGSVGGWCWLRTQTPPAAQRFGRTIALTGAAASLIGNATGHLLATGYLTPTPVLVVIVGAVPAAVLVALAHLAALLTNTPMRDGEEPTTRESLLHLIEEQPRTLTELAELTGRSRSTVSGHLTALVEAGNLRRDQHKRYHPAQRTTEDR